MTYRKTVNQFVSIAEARAHYLRQGYTTALDDEYSAIMTKVVDGIMVGEVIINREALFTVIAEKLERT